MRHIVVGLIIIMWSLILPPNKAQLLCNTFSTIGVDFAKQIFPTAATVGVLDSAYRDTCRAQRNSNLAACNAATDKRALYNLPIVNAPAGLGSTTFVEYSVRVDPAQNLDFSSKISHTRDRNRNKVRVMDMDRGKIVAQ